MRDWKMAFQARRAVAAAKVALTQRARPPITISLPSSFPLAAGVKLRMTDSRRESLSYF